MDAWWLITVTANQSFDGQWIVIVLDSAGIIRTGSYPSLWTRTQGVGIGARIAADLYRFHDDRLVGGIATDR